MTRRSRLLAAAILGALATLVPAIAYAHPRGNFSVNHYAGIRVSVHAVEVDLVIDMAEIPALDAIAALDTNRNGRAEPAELEAARRAACDDLSAQVTLLVDGDATHPGLTAAGMSVAPGAGGLVTLRTVCELHAALASPIESATQLTFTDGSHAERIGWREIVVLGDGVTVEAPDAAADVSARLTRYPADLLQQPLTEGSVDVTVRPGGPMLDPWRAPDAWPLDVSDAGAPASPASVPGGVSAELAAIVDVRNLTLPLALLGLLVAAIAGAGHAVSPGHGKTVMAAYLVSSRGGSRQALLLGGAVTVSHTIGVLLLAAVVLVAGRVLPPERLYPVLTAVSGVMVVLIGAALLVGCVRRVLATHRHDHDRPHTHGHGWRQHTHEPSSPIAWRGLAALGIAGGLVPSTSALILLLGAIGAGQPAYGLALAIAFGIGMAAVLTAIGMATVHGRTLLGRVSGGLPGVRQLAAAVPWVAALVVLAGGLALTGQTLAVGL